MAAELVAKWVLLSVVNFAVLKAGMLAALMDTVMDTQKALS